MEHDIRESDSHSSSGKFKTFDRIDLFYRYFDSSNSSKFLVILHGLGEHSKRYERLIEKLQKQNIACACFDYRGHGQSEGSEVYVNRFDDYLKDVSCFVEFMRRQFRMPRKFIILGNSMGGLVAAKWAMMYPEELNGLILTSPCFGLSVPKAYKIINSAINLIWPKFKYRNAIKINDLTHDHAEMNLYKYDSQIKKHISARLVYEILKCAREIDGIIKWEMKYPIKILIAECDKVVDNQKTMQLFNKIISPQKELKVFEHFYHELLHEIDCKNVYETIQAMLTRIN